MKRIVPIVLLAGCVLVAGIYSWCAIRGYRSSALSEELREDSLGRAIALEPRNASAFNAMCRYRMNADLDPAGAIQYCQRACELNKYNASYWLDLAEAFQDTGQHKEQRHAIESAIAVDPTTPEVAWSAANAYLVQGELEPALRQLSVVLQNDPNLVPHALRICWRSVGDAAPILKILPPDPAIYLQFVRLLVSQKQFEAAREVWSKMIALERPFDYQDALFYVDQLLASRNVKAAQQVWKQIGTRSTAFIRYERSDQNLVVNGSFESELLDAGFGWRVVPIPGTTISIDPEETPHGGRSLCVTYNVPVIDSGLLQLVPVDKDAEYTLSAWMKSEDLQTAQGPRVTISDAYTGAPLGKTDPVSGTTGWRQVATSFQTGPETSLVALRLSRDRGDTVVRGRLWISKVQMTMAGSAVVVH